MRIIAKIALVMLVFFTGILIETVRKELGIRGAIPASLVSFSTLAAIWYVWRNFPKVAQQENEKRGCNLQLSRENKKKIGGTMRLGNFSVKIPQGKKLNSGYVAMKHDTKYTVVLSNDGDVRCDAEVEIDGKIVGTWRIQSRDSMVIERPVHDTGCFTFYKIGTREAKKAAIVKSDKLGLITVLFKPERKPEPPDLGDDELDSFFCLDEGPHFSLSCDDEDVDLDLDDALFAEEELEAGGTGLSGKSKQEFRSVEPLDYDETGFVQINIRLVCQTDEPRPLTPVSTPVPPPL